LTPDAARLFKRSREDIETGETGKRLDSYAEKLTYVEYVLTYRDVFHDVHDVRWALVYNFTDGTFYDPGSLSERRYDR
jgi:hypothetical protein